MSAVTARSLGPGSRLPTPLDQWRSLIEADAFEGRRVELLHGEVVESVTEGPRHADTKNEVFAGLVRAASASGTAMAEALDRIRTERTLEIPDHSSVPADVLVTTARVEGRHPRPADLLVLVEVADVSSSRDHGPKLRLYAEAGVPEYWIVSAVTRDTEVYRRPSGSAYTDRSLVPAGSPAGTVDGLCVTLTRQIEP